jgi:cytochrome c-type biogenesis protein CcmH
MFLSLLFTLLVLTALLPLVVPMLRRAETVPERGYFDRKVYRDQLRELDRDVGRGLLSETDIAEARLEIQRRLLATDTVPAAHLPGWPDRSPVMATIVALFVAGGTVGLYAWLGAPKPPGVVFVSRPTLAGDIPAPVLEHSDLVRAAARLAEKLQADPFNAERWVLVRPDVGQPAPLERRGGRLSSRPGAQSGQPRRPERPWRDAGDAGGRDRYANGTRCLHGSPERRSEE